MSADPQKDAGKSDPAPHFTVTSMSWPAPPVGPGDRAGFIVLRDATEGPVPPPMTVFKTHKQAQAAAAEARVTRDTGGYSYGVYVAVVTIVTVAAEEVAA